MTLRKDSERYGCDYCKKDKSTWLFNHFDILKLWICGDCYKKLIKKPKGVNVRNHETQGGENGKRKN